MNLAVIPARIGSKRIKKKNIKLFNGMPMISYVIKECLNSILNQSSSSWECIVVDDGSTDKTIETVVEYSKQYPQIKFLKRNSRRKSAKC